jgi:hypothetical protein
MPIWSLRTIDDGLAVVKAKRDAAQAKGDLVAAANHQAWMDRLLDMRTIALRGSGSP